MDPMTANPLLVHGDCLDELAKLDESSVDAVVTDPPYGISFMGQKWDYDVPATATWEQVFRVLKPGGHLLCFAGTRTQHRMAVNIEDAGFEIRDMIAWVYGSGFPKSHNIGKAVDKLQGNEREFVSENPANRPYNLTKGETSTGWKSPPRPDKTKGNSPYEGWGTALKPALEPITVARKPFKGTVAKNVLKWGTGGINIDGCRVKYEVGEVDFSKRQRQQADPKEKGWSGHVAQVGTNIQMFKPQGRFPANLIHDGSDEVLDLFPETKTGKVASHSTKGMWGSGADTSYQDIDNGGSAARFFYCAKASKSERNGGNNHPTVKPIKLMQYLVRLVTPKDGTVLDPFMGSGTTGIACRKEGFDFIGIELDEDYFEIAKARIEKFKFQHELF